MIIDYKPKNSSILDQKPTNKAVFEAKPKNKGVDDGLTDQLFAVTLGRGMLVGFGPYITYPNDIDIISPKSP